MGNLTSRLSLASDWQAASLQAPGGRRSRDGLLWCLSLTIVAWSFLEASFWWVAPDITLAVAWVYFPRQWPRFLLLGLAGALLGSWVTYAWAQGDAQGWERYVLQMRFHSAANVAHVRQALGVDPWTIVKGAWQGVPYKIFFGVAASQGAAFWPLAGLGLVSRLLRFVFTLGVSWSVRKLGSPWSLRHPFALCVLLTSVWVALIGVFDVLVNRRLAP